MAKKTKSVTQKELREYAKKDKKEDKRMIKSAITNARLIKK